MKLEKKYIYLKPQKHGISEAKHTPRIYVQINLHLQVTQGLSACVSAKLVVLLRTVRFCLVLAVESKSSTSIPHWSMLCWALRYYGVPRICHSRAMGCLAWMWRTVQVWDRALSEVWITLRKNCWLWAYIFILSGYCWSGWREESCFQSVQPLFVGEYGIKHFADLRCYLDQMSSFFLNFDGRIASVFCTYSFMLLGKSVTSLSNSFSSLHPASCLILKLSIR